MTAMTQPRSSSMTTPTVAVRQYGVGRVLAVWAAAAVPMGLLAWAGAPLLAGRLHGATALPRALILALTAGLLWQLVLVLWLVRAEQRSLRWGVVRRALWLQAPHSSRTGRSGGLLWLVLLPMTLLFTAEQLIPEAPHPVSHDFGAFLGSDAGRALLADPVWVAVVLLLMVLNTVLGEELLFRGLLLPRMSRAFGRWDWLANGVLFAAYHLHQPWSTPAALVDTVALALPARRYRSALLSIVVHSTQTVFFGVAVLVIFAG